MREHLADDVLHDLAVAHARERHLDALLHGDLLRAILDRCGVATHTVARLDPRPFGGLFFSSSRPREGGFRDGLH